MARVVACAYPISRTTSCVAAMRLARVATPRSVKAVTCASVVAGDRRDHAGLSQSYRFPMQTLPISEVKDRLNDLVDAASRTHEQVTMNEKVNFPAVPMLGVIGVAPESGEIATMPAGKHGGNLDNNMNRKGSIVHLPVKHKGALLGMGDMHASMGDGEICGTGVEIAGDVLIKVDVIKGITTDFPVTETADSWITHGVAVEDLTLALKLACEEAAGLLVNHWGFTYEDAFIFLSVAGDLGIAQSVHPSSGTVIAKMRVPKIAACPKPFKI